MKPAVIQTARLRLRPWREEDKPPFRALNADPRVMAFFPSVRSVSLNDAPADHPLHRHCLYRISATAPA
jgi:RimJ/RimL family protein N-acetyltransferase